MAGAHMKSGCPPSRTTGVAAPVLFQPRLVLPVTAAFVGTSTLSAKKNCTSASVLMRTSCFAGFVLLPLQKCLLLSKKLVSWQTASGYSSDVLLVAVAVGMPFGVTTPVAKPVMSSSK